MQLKKFKENNYHLFSRYGFKLKNIWVLRHLKNLISNYLKLWCDKKMFFCEASKSLYLIERIKDNLRGLFSF